MTLGFVVAERVLYVPSIGFCLLLGIVLDHYMPANGGEATSDGAEHADDGKGRAKAGKAKGVTETTLSTAGKIALGVALVVIAAYFAR